MFLDAHYVEREKQRNLLSGLLEKASEGQGQVALLSGAVASGKSALLMNCADRALAEGALLLDTAGVPAERDRPFGLLGRIFASAPLTSAAHAEVARLIDGVAGGESSVHDQMLAMPQLSAVLLELAKDHLVVIAVDDVHDSDQASLRFLLYLTRRIRHCRMLVVLTEPARLESGKRGFHTELAHLPHCTLLRLKLLSPMGTVGLLSEHFTPSTAARLAPELHDITGGSPLLLRALVEDRLTATEAGDPYQPLVRGDNYAQAVLDCLHRCGPEPLEIARGIAVLGAHTGPGLLSRLLGLHLRDVEQAVADLGQCGLLSEGRFRDEQAAAVVRDAVPADRLSKLHTRAAELLHQDGSAANDIARHLVVAGDTADLWTVPVLQEAAEYALADGDMDFAHRCLALARNSCRDDRVRASLTVKLAGVVWRTDPAAVDIDAPALLLDARAGRLSPGDLVVSLSYLAWSGRLHEAREVLEALEGTDGWSGREERTALTAARRWLTVLSPSLGMEPGGEEPMRPGPADTLAGDAEIAHLHASSAVAAALSESRREDAVAEATRVLQRYRLDDGYVQPLALALWALVYAGRLDLAAPWCERLLNESADHHARPWQAVFTSVRAETALRQGDLPGAKVHAEAALRHLGPRGWSLARTFPLATLIQAHTGMGQFDEAESLLGQTVPEAFLHTLPGLHYARARGRWNLATGRYHAALGDFLACGEALEEWGIDAPELVPWRLDAAETWLALGHPDKARSLAEQQLLRSPDRARGTALRLVGATGEGRRGLQQLQEAVEILENGGDRLQLALCLGELGRLYRVMDDVNRARMLVRKAWHVAKSCGAEPLCRQLIPGGADPDAETPRHEPVLPQDTAALTEAESRVAVLAAHGNTNREIAARLYVTVSTVEQHLTRIYRKLKVNRRRDLSTRLAGGGDAQFALNGRQTVADLVPMEVTSCGTGRRN
ncbi:helix-turn-helix transcriptional regulator [Streptomyces sp. NRRL S-920]|uniref:helix-turn-helix transcriptional regulator n=1 Tax=Streptomyces sp. NRRL S-920 TaxID=1463921 RepID=UPI0007C4C3F3|nr:AAA family ATPase [Streptomyces sp. NRRL S-920]